MPLVLLFRLLTKPSASDCLERILSHFDKVVPSAINGDQTRHRFLSYALRDVANLETRPPRLTVLAYKWCSAIYGNRENLEDWENLLLLCLEIGFRHLDPRQSHADFSLTHTEHHRGVVDAVFKSKKSEAIADLLHAWTLKNHFFELADIPADVCRGLLVGLQDLVPFSPRLRQLVIRSIEIAGHKGFEGAEVERLTELLDHLRVTVEDVGEGYKWMPLLLDVIRSSEGIRCLSHLYWELLVELAVLTQQPRLEVIYSPTITKTLVEAQEWGKLECWIGIVWMLSQGDAGRTDGHLENSMLLLFRQRPGAAQKLEEWMERWSRQGEKGIPESFRQTCKRAHEAAQQQVVT